VEMLFFQNHIEISSLLLKKMKFFGYRKDMGHPHPRFFTSRSLPAGLQFSGM
jgi:hypothetical protein